MAGGGEGAKERRRLKRLAKAGAASTEATHSKPSQNSDTRNASDGTKSKSFSKKTSETNKFSKKHDFKKNDGKKTDKKMKFKVKKPKHLKRKLEQLESTDEQAREKLLQVMTTYEANKLKYSKHKNTSTKQRKKQKTKSLSSPNTRPEKVFAEAKDDVVTSEPNQDSQISVNGKEAKGEAPPPIVEMSERVDKDESDSDDDDNKSDHDAENEQKRQRGRRRRGRKDTSKHIQETKDETEKKTMNPKKMKVDSDEKDPASKEAEKSKKDIDARYCVGRKPVTDFVIGQKYSGKVIYVKPFGVFIDIGCHSDAFCHVSRLQDDFVEDPSALFKEGDVVEARLVEIDRKQKRLTVSFQSEKRIDHERASVEAREQRKKSRKTKGGVKHTNSTMDESRHHEPAETSSAPKIVSAPKPIIPRQNSISQPGTKPHATKSMEDMTPAELKRARKLARRAARREQAAGQEAQ